MAPERANDLRHLGDFTVGSRVLAIAALAVPVGAFSACVAWTLLRLIGSTAAYAVSVLLLRRSVLTEKLARRGVHLNREYSVDPLETLFVGDVMDDGPAAALDPTAPAVYADDTLRHVAYVMVESDHTILPVVQREGTAAVMGSIGLEQLLAATTAWSS